MNYFILLMIGETYLWQTYHNGRCVSRKQNIVTDNQNKLCDAELPVQFVCHLAMSEEFNSFTCITSAKKSPQKMCAFDMQSADFSRSCDIGNRNTHNMQLCEQLENAMPTKTF